MSSVCLQVVVKMIAKEENWSDSTRSEHVAEVLGDNWIDTVGSLRKLSKERIEKLDLPPVVTEYLLRVKG
jgi:hypothetical protein